MRGLGSRALQLENQTWLKKWKGGQEKDKTQLITYFKKGYYDKARSGVDGRQARSGIYNNNKQKNPTLEFLSGVEERGHQSACHFLLICFERVTAFILSSDP